MSTDNAEQEFRDWYGDNHAASNYWENLELKDADSRAAHVAKMVQLDKDFGGADDEVIIECAIDDVLERWDMAEGIRSYVTAKVQELLPEMEAA